MHEIILLLGYPAAGKTEASKQWTDRGYVRLNRDTLGGKVDDLLRNLDTQILAGKGQFVLDNLFPTRASRKPFIDLAQQHGIRIHAFVMGTTIEESQYNACLRMIQKAGKILSPDEIKAAKDPNLLPPAVLFSYRKEYEKPTQAEGFHGVTNLGFTRKPTGYKNKALILDYDGCLRVSAGGHKWPTDPFDVSILPGRRQVLDQFKDAGYLLLGASNQSAIAKGVLTTAQAEACFQKTNELLKHDIEYTYCPHKIPPITCWCRKPQPGMGVQFVEKHKLDNAQTIFVGDMTTDKTFAARCNFQFCDSDEFFFGAYKKFLN